MTKHAVPIIAAILLCLPVVYVGSYFALVTPRTADSYRIGGTVAARCYWPLEQLDRRYRKDEWFAGDLDRIMAKMHYSSGPS